MKVRCYRKILCISYTEHTTNEQVRNIITQTIGLHEDLLSTVKRRKLQWYGHVSRHDSIAKTILQGTMKGKGKRGRQRKRWEDNIQEWTGMNFATSQRAAEDREGWCRVVHEDPVVPLRPP